MTVAMIICILLACTVYLNFRDFILLSFDLLRMLFFLRP